MRALLLLVCVALSATAFAQGNSVAYRAKQDDTLDVIAAEYYGDRAQAKLIVAENKLKQKRVQPGQRLKIPVTREIVTDKGDTFESLAQTHLGDARRAVVLADFNERDVSDTPAIGTTISIPIQITHTAQGTETLASIATAYWNDPKQAEVLRRYNFLDKPSIEKGESVIVPMIKVRVRKPAPLDTDAKERRDEQHKVATEAERVLPLARTAWLAGEFKVIRETLEPLVAKADYLETPEAIEVGLLLGKAQLAFKDDKHATESFTHVLNRKPSHVLSAYAESPKVIDAWKKAGGQVAP
ncbi:MAG TPA: LysM peptidoglycan-binding domain-containing protein [Kofleriaceae bacterium]|nr:LysM peptidoglycan-binding domain-containing protein [Kofleriaceae bacterium]